MSGYDLRTGLTSPALMLDAPRCPTCRSDLLSAGDVPLMVCRRCRTVHDTRPGYRALVWHLIIDCHRLKGLRAHPPESYGRCAVCRQRGGGAILDRALTGPFAGPAIERQREPGRRVA